LKSITEKLVTNVSQFGDTGGSKQTALQYNIWKQSIQQREQDEMFFTVLISFILIILAIMINLNINNSFDAMKEIFGKNFASSTFRFINAAPS